MFWPLHSEDQSVKSCPARGRDLENTHIVKCTLALFKVRIFPKCLKERCSDRIAEGRCFDVNSVANRGQFLSGPISLHESAWSGRSANPVEPAMRSVFTAALTVDSVGINAVIADTALPGRPVRRPGAMLMIHRQQ